MTNNLFITVFRIITKHKEFSITNIFGLAIGFTAFMLISLFVKYEYSWDTNNENYDRIYRIQQKVMLNGKEEIWISTQPALNDLLKDKYPELEKVLLLQEVSGEYLSSSQTRIFSDEEGLYADQSVFDIFSYDFVQGFKASALVEPFSIVLSKTLANKLFPNNDALDKVVLLDKKYNLKVTGIYNDLPKNSSILPGYIISLNSSEKINGLKDFRSNWKSSSCSNYVMLKKGQDWEKFSKKIEGIYEEMYPTEKRKFYLLPLSKQFLMPGNRNDYMVAIVLYQLIAVFILILTCINYVNLSTANVSTRSKEIAVKKVCGSSKLILIKQFLAESVVIASIAVLIAFLFTYLLLPIFNQIIGRELEFSILQNWHFIIEIIFIALMAGFISGIYPAFFMSSYKTVDLFKGNIFKQKREKIGPKKILVSFQFVISIFLIICTIMIYKQITFIKNKEIGMDKENLVYTAIQISRNDVNFEDLRARVLKYPEITEAAISKNIPLYNSNGILINWEGGRSDEKLSFRYNIVNYDFIKILKLKIIEGRGFSRSFSADNRSACIINETACKALGWKNPVGRKINDNKWKIVGVVKDFNARSVHDEIQPYVMLLQSDSIIGRKICSFRVAPGKIQEAIAILTKEFEEYFPTDPFEFRILSEDFKQDFAFKIWGSVNNTFIFFTIMVIFLAILGLLGLVSFSTKRKTKEIAIRKINGSTIQQIFIILSSEYMVLLIIASLVAWPGAYIMYKFLPGAYKYQLQLWEFLTGTFIIFVIALISTSYQTIKAALQNPVISLRYE